MLRFALACFHVTVFFFSFLWLSLCADFINLIIGVTIATFVVIVALAVGIPICICCCIGVGVGAAFRSSNRGTVTTTTTAGTVSTAVTSQQVTYKHTSINWYDLSLHGNCIRSHSIEYIQLMTRCFYTNLFLLKSVDVLLSRNFIDVIIIIITVMLLLLDFQLVFCSLWSAQLRGLVHHMSTVLLHIFRLQLLPIHLSIPLSQWLPSRDMITNPHPILTRVREDSQWGNTRHKPTNGFYLAHWLAIPT